MIGTIRKRRHQSGFTLIELLIVVAIIGILAAVGIPMYMGYITSSKISASKTNHINIRNFMSAKLTECSSGKSYIQFTTGATKTGRLPCNFRGTEFHDAFWAQFKIDGFKNPYDTSKDAVVINWSTTLPQGFTYIITLQNTYPIIQRITTNIGDSEAPNNIMSHTIYME